MKKNLFKVIDIITDANISTEDLCFCLDVITDLYKTNLLLTNIINKEAD